MPSYRPYDSSSCPWSARAKRGWRELWLGNFSTKEEAAEAEQKYAETHPVGKGGWTKGKKRDYGKIHNLRGSNGRFIRKETA